MPIPLENRAMVERGWPGAGWSCERSAGPRWGQAHSARPSARPAKFHAPEIVFGPGALAELAHCAARLGARRLFLVTDPGLIEAGRVDAGVAYLRQSGAVLPQLARTTLKDACLATNPREADARDIEALFRAAL